MNKEIKKELIAKIFSLNNLTNAMQENCYCNRDKSKSHEGDICKECLGEIKLYCNIALRKINMIINIIEGLE